MFTLYTNLNIFLDSRLKENITINVIVWWKWPYITGVNNHGQINILSEYTQIWFTKFPILWSSRRGNILVCFPLFTLNFYQLFSFKLKNFTFLHL